MTVIFINSKDKTIKNVNIDKDNLLSFLQSRVAEYSGLITSANYIYNNKQENVIYVDDEGLLEQKYPLEGFVYKDNFYAGNGAVVGTNENGESISTNINLETMISEITFDFKVEEEIDKIIEEGTKIYTGSFEDFLITDEYNEN